MATPAEIKRLVERFAEQHQVYHQASYNETQVRREFIDPLFKELGWDIDNASGQPEQYKDVIHEDAIKVGGLTKAPDYCFRTGGERQFFVEAKKPSVNVAHDVSPAFQLRRYAWSAGMPLGIVTDFEEFSVYDCTAKPHKGDSAAKGRIFHCRFSNYPEKWDELTTLFSKPAVENGSLTAYDKKKARGSATVDKAFLKEIEGWRDSLARNIALRNPDLDQSDLNRAVQLTIDRIIFLRIGEDRGTEPYGSLVACTNGSNVYGRLLELFRAADDRYNSGLFHFRHEKEASEHPDKVTPKLSIDDAVLKSLIKGLYFPESPYEFSVLPVDILGQVYEQFLGKVIRLTAGHRAVVEEKPEVRKAGGVYYTPTYIVDYIVEHTVGELTKGKTPGAVAKLSILDPACGSGSFLLGAYEYLLDWHRDYYIDKGASKHKKQLFQGRAGDWRLTTAEKKRILLNNIHGVDIDVQAVEVTKLSLMLKMLEGESGESINANLRLFHQRVLPDLGKNIKCGNSLIGTDFYQQQSFEGFADEERQRINAFDWDIEFEEIMKGGGFDVVIGNPPYGGFLETSDASYLAAKFPVYGKIKDVYIAFIEHALASLKNDGMLSYIVPSSWLGGPGYISLRSTLLQHSIGKVVLLPFDIFKDAYIDTLVFTVSKNSKIKGFVQTYIFDKRKLLTKIEITQNQYGHIPQGFWERLPDKKFILHPGALKLLNKAQTVAHKTLGDLMHMKRGVLFDKKLLTTRRITKEHLAYFEGDVYRYKLNYTSNHWIEFDGKLKERPQSIHWFTEPRILLRRLVSRQLRLMATYADKPFITNKNLYSIVPNDLQMSLFAILGIINSRLISFMYVSQVTGAHKDDFAQVTIKDFLALPIPNISKQTEKALENNVKALLAPEKSDLDDVDTVLLNRQIASSERNIDSLIYKLYELTDAEIKLVEEAI